MKKTSDVAVIDRNAPCKTYSNNNKIVKGTLSVISNGRNIILDRLTLVVPAYLVVVISEISVNGLIDEVLYTVLRVKRLKISSLAYVINKSTLENIKTCLN